MKLKTDKNGHRDTMYFPIALFSFMIGVMFGLLLGVL